jgi:uncharacterized protein YdaU (DUF1376 family)
VAIKAPTLAMLPWFPRDYVSATRGMTLAERGAYTDLLWFEWDTGPLPQDPKRLARMLGVDAEEFAQVWPVVRLKFVANEDGLIINARLEKERTNSIALRTKASEKAQQAAKARWASDASSNARGNASSINNGSIDRKLVLGAMLEQCPPSPSPSPSSAPTSSPTLGEEGGPGEGEPVAREKPVGNKGPRPKAEKIQVDAVAKARKMIAAQPEFSDAEIARVANVKLADVKAARTH